MSSLKRHSPATATSLPQQKSRRKKFPDAIVGNDANNHSTDAGDNQKKEPTCQRIMAEPRKRKKSLAHGEAAILEELLYPYKVNDFLNESFRQHAVHVRWNDPRCDDSKRKTGLRFPNVPMLQKLMDDPDIASLVRETSSENVFVWLSKQQQKQERVPDYHSNGSTKQVMDEKLKTATVAPLIQSIDISDPDTAIKLHEMGGHALYFRAPPPVEQTLVASLLRSTGLGCGQYNTSKLHTSLGRGEVEVFIGGHQHVSPNRMNQPDTHLPNNNFVTGWHYDFQENFTIQISGMKRWTLHSGVVKHPLRGCTPHYDIVSLDSVMESQVLASRLADETLQSPTSMTTAKSASCSKLETVDMCPGDVLYFPAGMWHTVETIEPGISINVSLMASNYATIMCQSLQHFLLRNEEWRQCIQNRDGSAIEQLQKLVHSLPNMLQASIDNNEWNARMMLPPVLYEPMGNGSEHDEDDEDNDDDDDETDTVVNIKDVVLPHIIFDGVDVFHRWPMKSHRLCKNPLAILLHEENEIRNCYLNFQPCQSDVHYAASPITDTDSSNLSSVYVLNVNFAGNESHESMVRYRLLLNDDAVQEILRLVSGNELLLTENKFDQEFPERTKHHVNCLVYYGFLTWEKIQLK